MVVYICPVDETMTDTEEMFPFVIEVLYGVLMGFCLERGLEIDWGKMPCVTDQPWVMLKFVLK